MRSGFIDLIPPDIRHKISKSRTEVQETPLKKPPVDSVNLNQICKYLRQSNQLNFISRRHHISNAILYRLAISGHCKAEFEMKILRAWKNDYALIA